ncbi:MAG: KUP/HAK/KT family potassium transporter, partial [Alphaproteobacteria bacterium]|nr:KUP/HAK/KT family potassium transporter [Alphaproteobacteria bacterium]
MLLTLGALGVVFGDIGTSPLYAMRETVIATGGMNPGHTPIYGALSLILWALIIIVTLKYVVLIMRADNNGEGGVLALATLAHRQKVGRSIKAAIGFGAILGLALFYGDGMLTPAISVLSAVEGLTVGRHSLEPLVMPITLIILIGLFLIQSRGTALLGRLFGPIMVIWFLIMAVLGVSWIVRAPQILSAISPHYAIQLVMFEPWTAFVALGSVVLAVTGCEALYADMGHFGKRPIRIAWGFALVCLVLNYFGQGASLMINPHHADTVFYSMAPAWAHYPLIGLATLATIIASQAVISGVFSITRQSVQLGQLPRMEIRHTSMTDFGQIYVPRMNAILLIGVVLIVLIFRSSSNLAAAYGIAVAGVMVIDTFHVSLVAARQWHWGLKLAAVVFGALALIDVTMLLSNMLKIPQGGWLPLAIATGVFLVMETWRIGRRAHQERIRSESMPMSLLLERADKTPMRVAGSAVFLSARNDVVPGALLHNLKHNKVLHERIILCNVIVEDRPLVEPSKRLEVEKLGKGFFSVRIHHGFFETPDVPRALAEARPFGIVVDVETATFFIGHETLVPAEHPQLGRWRTWLYMLLASNALSPARFYHLP